MKAFPERKICLLGLEGRGWEEQGKAHKGKYVGTQWLKEGEEAVPGKKGAGAERQAGALPTSSPASTSLPRHSRPSRGSQCRLTSRATSFHLFTPWSLCGKPGLPGAGQPVASPG